MSYDNRIFNVNGKGDDFAMFRRALCLAFDQERAELKVEAFKEDTKFGLLIARYEVPNGSTKLPCPMGADALAVIVWEWLKSCRGIEMEGWDKNADHDGHNEIGWRIYAGDWGHVGNSDYFLAIKPAYCWYGK